MRRPRVSIVVFLALLAGAVQAPTAAAENVPNPEPGLIARWEPCEPNTGVTVIVDDRTIGAGKVYVGCAPGEQTDGVQALENAGFAPEGTADYGLAFICRIDGEPTPAETPCTTTPGNGAYWSYWRGKPGGRWSFSGVGAESPQSRSPVNSVEGWSFGAGDAPRIEPMDGSGPSSFSLPPAQESSTVPASLAREWLAPVLDKDAALAEELEAKKVEEHPEAEKLLPGVLALARAGVEPTKMKQISDWLARSCEEKHVEVEGCPLRELANPKKKYAEHFALAVLALQALGQSPFSFAGRDLREELEDMVSKGTGEVESEGSHTNDVEVTAPTVLALARTGPLSAKALKTVDLILAEQNTATGSWETTTSATAEALEALAAAREQGAGALGQARLEQVDAAVAEAGDYLESIEEPGGGVREAEGSEKVDDPSVKSTALGAVGLALAGRQAAAELAAKWVSRYQVTAEYAGTGNPETGEHTPAEDVIGAFLPGEAALREALAYGVKSNNYGLYFEAQEPTIDALLALVTVGPYARPENPPPSGGPEGPGQSAGTGTTSSEGSQEVLGSHSASPVRVQTPRLDGRGADRGLVGVSWRVLDSGPGLSSWTISSRTLGVAGAGYVVRATGSARATSALVRLPAGAAYELQITFTDTLGRSSTTQIGKVLVPYGARWSGLHYRGRWRRLKLVGAWLDTVSRGGAGARVSETLGAGRPVFMLRATPAAAKVEVRAGSHRQVFALAAGAAASSRQITAAGRSTAGPVSLLVLKGTVDLDGVADER